ncbi:hypothetical protein Tco_1141191 [Tanacetum coccineum]
MTRSFISGLRPRRFFKDLIARPPASMEDLFTQAHNFIRADEANTENRLRDSRWVPNDNKSGQGYKDTSRRHKDKYVHRLRVRPNERTNVNNSSFTPLIKSSAEIYATSEGKAVLRPPSRMFAPAHRRDRTRYWFAGQVLWPIGVITIPLTLFDYHIRGSKTVTTYFLIVRAPLPYNVILGRPGMRQLGAIASTIHSLLKFSTPTGVAIVRGDMPCKDTCLQVSRIREREPEEATKLASPENKSEKEEVEINPLYPDQKVIIGTSLPLKLKEELQKLLRANQDIFAWSPTQ